MIGPKNAHAADRLFERFGIVLDATLEESILTAIESGKSLLRIPADRKGRPHHLVEVEGPREPVVVEVVLAHATRAVVTALLPTPVAIAAYRTHIGGGAPSVEFTDEQNQAMLAEWRNSCGAKRKVVARALGIREDVLKDYEDGAPCPSYILTQAVQLLRHDTRNTVDKVIARGRIERSISANAAGMAVPSNEAEVRKKIEVMLGNAIDLAKKIEDDALVGRLAEVRDSVVAPPQPCDDCKGDGSVEITPPLFGYGAHVVACQYCGGTGKRSGDEG